MSNTTKRPVIEWLQTIADQIVRESAIRQCTNPDMIVPDLPTALERFIRWTDTKEGDWYWHDVCVTAKYGELATIEPNTISPSATDWMQEVHQMD